MRVLIIDDEEDVRRIASLSLANVGEMEVAEAESAAKGIEAASRFNPDVILLDVMMPETDGPATLALLRSRPETASIPVVFVTARAMEAEVEELRRLGASGVITKPFNALTLPDQLRDAIS